VSPSGVEEYLAGTQRKGQPTIRGPAGEMDGWPPAGVELPEVVHPEAQEAAAGASDVMDVMDVIDVMLEAVSVVEVTFGLTAGGVLLLVVWTAAPRLIAVAAIGLPVLAAGVLGLARIPTTSAAILLLVLAAASLVMEVLVTRGLLLHAVGGGLALALAGLWLEGPGRGAHPCVVLPVAAAVTLGTWLAARRSWGAVRDNPFAESPCLRGRTGTVLDAQDCHGHAVIAGQLWTITTTGRPLRAGGQVEVVSAATDCLIVAPTRRLPG
jgi:membrane-bound ClpP family serine protease